MPGRFQSPLSNLCDVLTQIRDSAKQYQTTLTKNEASTRAVLIDPILRALGWDTANTHMVEIEKTHGKMRADYALYDSNREPRIIIEAKALGTKLAQDEVVMSLVSYAFQFQLNDVFLTDGLIWHHYSDFRPTHTKPTAILNLTTDNPVDVAAYLVQQLDAARFWQVETVDLLAQRLEQLENTVATLERLLTLQASAPTRPTEAPPAAAPPRQEALPVPLPHEGLTFTDLSTLRDITGRRPAFYRLPDGSVLAVTRWKDVLRESCKYALATNAAIPIPLPDRSGRKVSLLSPTKPATGLAYVTEVYNGETVFMYVNYDANNCVSNALYILQYAPNAEKSMNPAVVLEG